MLGHEVITAADGIEGLEAAERYQPDVVFMDIGMPRLDGLEATRRLRAATWGKEIPVVALTGWGQDSDRLQSERAGCDRHLVKPVRLEEVERLLEELHPVARDASSSA
jgi:CheY-like chemotaxis protein